MNQKTEETGVSPEGHPSLAIEWICAMILGAILYFWSSARFPQFLKPWIAKAGVMIQSAMDAFAGRAPAVLDSGEHSTMLYGLLGGFVVGPAIFLLAWRKIR